MVDTKKKKKTFVSTEVAINIASDITILLFLYNS